MSFCMCGAQASYPHESDCPRPLYRGTESMEHQWRLDREALRQNIVRRATES